jgi:SAM-dependent methyltransferase
MKDKKRKTAPRTRPAVLDLDRIRRLQEKPPVFESGEPRFWDDAHISKSMLACHLDPETEAASRPPEIIERSADWIMEQLGLTAGDEVLDLGCGPGLYAVRFAGRGLKVTGVDLSRRSIAYARKAAKESRLDITYRCENYLRLLDAGRYRAAFLIYGDYCPLSPENRARLLQNVRRALRPGGFFVLDVTTPELRKKHRNTNHWYAAESGFWKPGPHLVLEQGFEYPAHSVFLDQYIVVESDGAVTAYRNWFRDFTREEIVSELQSGGFDIQGVWNDLWGTPYSEGGDWIGVIARKEE